MPRKTELLLFFRKVWNEEQRKCKKCLVCEHRWELGSIHAYNRKLLIYQYFLNLCIKWTRVIRVKSELSDSEKISVNKCMVISHSHRSEMGLFIFFWAVCIRTDLGFSTMFNFLDRIILWKEKTMHSDDKVKK